MSAPQKKQRKSAKLTTALVLTEEDAASVSRSTSQPISVAARVASLEQHESLRSTGSSEMSDIESPRSMVHGIIEVINGRVTTQLSSFLTNEIATLLATTRAEIVSQVQAEIIEMNERHAREKEELQRRLEAMEKTIQKQERWAVVEPELMAEVQKKQEEYLVLNVGGVEYGTSRSTMLKYPQSMLGAMFSGKYKAVTDPLGRYFIDRDGPLFRHILNYLRTDSLSTVDVTSASALIELLQESVYYQIESLTQLLTVHLSNVDAQENTNLQRYRSRGVDESSPTPSRDYGLPPVTHTSGSSASLNTAPTSNRLSLPTTSNSSSSPTSSSVTNAAARQIIRTFSYGQMTPRGRRTAHSEGPIYTREEIHQLTLKYGDRRRINLAGLDLRGLDLSKLDLSSIDFSRCNLQNTSFEGAHLVACSFAQANLKNANFQQAFMGEASTECPDFTDADLLGADFSRYTGTLFRSKFEGVEDNMLGLELRWLR